ncbi:M20/M25/M40 family metallo-hydrolase [Caulobacter sp. 602-1]|uniref:M20/M25/M40 family metallo-hydrolase n=1 Tax=Caulobacter sp. 602-1 TaxID=2492472 RepID=UPI000F63F0E6|nr:M20/M25/M40 family metallo-hydrolase [Caulobacter sp. 602-1]RRN63815.1 M20/M25/M40 family metallo-hydrolase [Caulobacter sp. 602-1]
MHVKTRLTPALILSLAFSTASVALAQPSPTIDKQAQALRKSRTFVALQTAITNDYERTVREGVTLTEIPAPTFKEEARAKAFAQLLQDAGLQNVEIDAVGNVTALRKGEGKGPLVAVIAHLDTVFPEGVPVKVRREGLTLHAPGVGDDTFPLAVLATYARALAAAKVRTRADILFVGSVGEEGLGDLRGVRHLFQHGPYAGKIASVIVFEPAAAGQLINVAVGARRYKVTFTGPGGHSFSDFGIVNPGYAMAGAMTAISRITTDPATRTTYNVGVVSGGTSPNVIPTQMSMSIDMRSEDPRALEALEARLRDALDQAVAGENAARSTLKGSIRLETEVLGDRPAGRTGKEDPLVQRAEAAMRSAGLTPRYDSASTDANLPMSLGLPAIVIGPGFSAKDGHSPEESLTLDPAHDPLNIATALQVILLQTGVEHP